jgi:uncharacterized protein YqjF (DUF2071 family)
MNTSLDALPAATSGTNLRARDRLLSLAHEPLFVADWDRALMIHYEVDAEGLQSAVPFDLDLIDGKAYVSLVAFTLRRMRPRFGGPVLEWLLKPIATHHFLNCRTYVRCRGESGIYFMTEWLANRLSVHLGPMAFGLPYRYGTITYNHDHVNNRFTGRVLDPSGSGFEYRAGLETSAGPCECEPGSLAEVLMERYTAFTCARGTPRFFRVWHEPWKQQPSRVEILDQRLLEANWPFFKGAKPASANYSPGLQDVWMGWPHHVPRIN